jgi:hypothetical protein
MAAIAHGTVHRGKPAPGPDRDMYRPRRPAKRGPRAANALVTAVAILCKTPIGQMDGPGAARS